MEDFLATYETPSQVLEELVENHSSTLSPQSYTIINETKVFQDYGPPRDALYVVVPITIIYASIFLTGIIGNVSTCIVIARNKSMHTATNYYLFSLAISDLLLLLAGLPPEIYLVWSKYPYIFGEIFCVLRGLAAETSTNATVLTITAFTVERYVAICHPFLSHTMSKLSRAIKLILIIWLVALSFAIPQALQFGIAEIPNKGEDLVVCTYINVIVKHSFELSTFLFFLVPMTLITVLYALIGLKLRKSNMMKRDSGNSSGYRKSITSNRKDRNCRHHTGRSSRRVLKMLVAVVVAFFICWAPFHVQRLIAVWGTNSTDHISSNSPWMEFLYLIFTYLSGVLYYVSTTINPILYNIMSNKFREAFMETLARCCRVGSFKNRRGQRRSYSTISRSRRREDGMFNCRNGGVGGAQESTDCSGNSQSVKDDSIQQSLSGLGCVTGVSNLVSKNPSSYDGTPHHLANSSTSKRSSSRRTLSTDVCNSEEAGNVSETGSLNHRSVQVSGYNYRGRWTSFNSNNANGQRLNDDQTVTTCDQPNCAQRVENPQNAVERVKVKGTAIVYRAKRKPMRSNRKWWNIVFKWLTNRRTKSESARRMSYSSPGPVENMIINVQINPEEYSMTSCNISNTSLRDVDRKAMDEELSAYMEEVRKREFQNEIRASANC